MEGNEQLDLFPHGKLRVTLLRLGYELMEEYGSFDNTVMIGLQPKGIYMGRRMQTVLKELMPVVDIPYGELDVTFFRDDFRKRDSPLQANQTSIDFLIEGKRVILVDDVLYTGRTIRSAMDAMLAYGRPLSVELVVLVDRQHQRELPIESRYCGITVDTIETQRVNVELREAGGNDEIMLVSQA